MSRFETVTSPPTLGAGRQMSWAFPLLGAQANAGSFPNNSAAIVCQRPMLNGTIIGTGGTGMLVTTVGVPPATAPSLACMYKGRYCISLNSDATTGRTWVINAAASMPGAVMPFVTVKGAQPSGLEDWGVWELSAILAFDQPAGPITGDIGFGVGVSTRTQIRLAGVQQAGIEVGPRDVGSIGIIARQTDLGATTIDQALAVQPADLTLFNNYKIRLISATATSEAKLKVLVNGQLGFSASWGAGSLLPEQALASGAYGFCPFMVNLKAFAGVTRMYVPHGGISVRAAPTEGALE